MSITELQRKLLVQQRKQSIANALGRYATGITEVGIDEFVGYTAHGKHFYLRTTCHNSSDYWSIDIDGHNEGMRCLFRTVLAKIKNK